MIFAQEFHSRLYSSVQFIVRSVGMNQNEVRGRVALFR
jgi:hypothetical protein